MRTTVGSALLTLTLSLSAGVAGAQSGAAAAQPAASAASAADTASQLTPADSALALETGRRYVEFYYETQADSLWAHMGPEFRARVRNADRIREVMFETAARLGDELKVEAERVAREGESLVYYRSMRFTEEGKLREQRWAFTADGTITGIDMREME